MTSDRVQGIVLAGSFHWGGSSFDKLLPRPLVPVAQTPLVCYSLRWLRDAGVGQATVCANSASRAVRQLLGNGGLLGMSLSYLEDWTPRGAAGCARDAGLRSAADTFVVADGTSVPSVDLMSLLVAHRQAAAAMTVVVHGEGGGRLQPTGIYVIDRRVFGFIAEKGFQDLKEVLIPKLHRAGERVVVHVATGPSPRVLDAETYLAVNQWAIEGVVSGRAPLDGYHAIESAVAHPTARIEPGAMVIGPVVLGPGTVVRAGSTVIGPTSLGPRTRIGAGAVVSRSVTWSDCVVGDGAQLDRSLLADGGVVDDGTSLVAAVKVPRRHRSGGFVPLAVPSRAAEPTLPLPVLGATPPRAGTA